MNLRTVLLKKISSIGPHNMDAPPEEMSPEHGWIAQGHFDFIWSCKSQKCNGNVFRIIQRSNEALSRNSSSTAYYHPLYLLSEEDDSAFWNVEKWFLAIVRIHFSTSIPQQNQHEEVAERIQRTFEKNGNIVQVYRTLELSDLVLAVKSDSIAGLLHDVLNLRRNLEIGRVYTYCGIDKDFVLSDMHVPYKTNKIPFCAMRFAVHDATLVPQALDEIEKRMGKRTSYAVIGVDDIIVNWESLNAGRLVALYRYFYQKATEKELTAFGAFSGLTTRLGTNPNFEEMCGHDNRIKELADSCNKLVVKIDEIRDRINLSTVDLGINTENIWLRSLAELTIVLFRLSKTSVLDEFAYLMLPAAEAFLTNVQAALNSPKQREFMKLNLEHCRLFVENWAHLMEHVMRIEGQLTQLPQLRPPLYDIPLTMLEYMLAFSSQCVATLKDVDDTDVPQDIRFLIVPKLCETIEAVELFRARKVSDATLPGLVLVSIPLHMMYNSGEVQLALCHEISHFVGEKYRLRTKRISYYADAVASLMENSIFQTESQDFEAACKEWVLPLLQRLNGARAPYIQDMEKKILSSLDKVFSPEVGPVEFSNLIHKLLLMVNERTGDHSFPVPTDHLLLCRGYSQSFVPQLNCITYLFREVLADIFMLLLLEPSPEVYLQSIATDLQSSEGAAYEPAGTRIYICLTAIGKPIPQCTSIMYSENTDLNILDTIIQRLQDKVACYAAEFIENSEIRCAIPPMCTEAMLCYARECAKSLQSALNTSKEKEELLQMFHSAHSIGTDVYKMQEYIFNHRASYLKNAE